MAASKDDAKNKSATREVQRGTQDELEILALIIQENQYLLANVLGKLRQVKSQATKKPGVKPEAKD